MSGDSFSLPHTERAQSGDTIEVVEQFVSVGMASRLLRISQSTAWRWIDSGVLPAYRFGHKRILVKQVDLELLVAPARAGQQERARVHHQHESDERPLSAVEQRTLALAIEEANHFRAELLARRDGKLFPGAAEDLAELRKQRSNTLR